MWWFIVDATNQRDNYNRDIGELASDKAELKDTCTMNKLDVRLSPQVKGGG